MLLSKRVILASRSPRRVALLRQVGIHPEVIPSDVPEELDKKLGPAANAELLAVEKARDVARRLSDALVLGADTIVTLDGVMLGKPADPADAVRMLTALSGRTHTVHTGYALVDRPSDRVISGVAETAVTFRELPADEIAEYVAGGSPLDKAGAYGIQDDYGAVFVTRIEGCFYNVVGLPLSRVHRALAEIQAPRSR